MRARASALAALASQLSGEQQAQALRQALEAAHTIEGAGSRAQALAGLLPSLPEQTAVVNMIRQSIVDHLAHTSDKHRAEVLRLLAVRELFTPPIVSSQTLSDISECIVEITDAWSWL